MPSIDQMLYKYLYCIVWTIMIKKKKALYKFGPNIFNQRLVDSVGAELWHVGSQLHQQSLVGTFPSSSQELHLHQNPEV